MAANQEDLLFIISDKKQNGIPFFVMLSYKELLFMTLMIKPLQIHWTWFIYLKVTERVSPCMRYKQKALQLSIVQICPIEWGVAVSGQLQCD